MARVYATRADLVAYAAAFGNRYTVPAEPEATGRLTQASRRIESIITAPYDVDSVTLLPTDADVTAALRDATCAFVLQHLDASADSAAGSGYSTVSIGSVTLTGKADAASASSDPLGPDPYEHLVEAGLVSTAVATSW